MSGRASWSRSGPTTSRDTSRGLTSRLRQCARAAPCDLFKLDIATPHFTDRVDQAQQLVASRDDTLALADADRELLRDTLRGMGRGIGERGGVEQLLHGEPHPGNVLTTKNGLLFIDLKTCCRGPVEFDLAHAPEEVSEHYPGLSRGLLRECRILVLAMITTWRWDQATSSQTGASSPQNASARSKQRSNAMGGIRMADHQPSHLVGVLLHPSNAYPVNVPLRHRQLCR